MVRVISLAEAQADGVGPNELLSIADWHDDRCEELGKSKSKGKAKARQKEIDRHRKIAFDLRETAGRLTRVAA